MPRMWAQEWRTNGGKQRFSMHRNRDDVVAFGTAYNHSTEHVDKLNQQGKPYQVSADPAMYSRICDTGYGQFVNWRP